MLFRKEKEGVHSPEQEKEYKIDWVVSDNVAVIRPVSKKEFGIPIISILNDENMRDAIEELASDYKISSMLALYSQRPYYKSSVETLLIVVDKKP